MKLAPPPAAGAITRNHHRALQGEVPSSYYQRLNNLAFSEQLLQDINNYFPSNVDFHS